MRLNCKKKNQKTAQQEKQIRLEHNPLFDEDFELLPDDFDQTELIDFIHSAQNNIDIFSPQQVDDVIPSFSLGIDEYIYIYIYGQDEAIPNGDDFVTPKPALREKSTRILKLS